MMNAFLFFLNVLRMLFVIDSRSSNRDCLLGLNVEASIHLLLLVGWSIIVLIIPIDHEIILLRLG